MPSSSDQTKKRLLDAAADEFADLGIAGARTGRIARTAGVNESLLFRYFGSKQSLFEQVYDSLVAQTVNEVVLDATKLAHYAGMLFDYYRDHEQVLRISVWAALEKWESIAGSAVLEATAHKTGAILAAQRSGLVSDQLPAGELLALVIQLSLSGASVSPALGTLVDLQVRRVSVVSAVSVLAEVRTKRKANRGGNNFDSAP